MYIQSWRNSVPKQLVMLAYGLTFIVALMLTNKFINLISTPPKTPNNLGDISTKLEYFTEHKDDYDVIFLGPSTTYNGVIPKVFDEVISANGENFKSFNFGVMGANLAELDFYLQKILALKPAKLKWIFLDCIVNFFQDRSANVPRSIYWHTPTHTLENFKLIAESHTSLLNKIIGFYTNTIGFIYHCLGIGDFSNLWQQRPNILPEGISAEKLLQESGYYAMDWKGNVAEWSQVFQSKYRDAYLQRLKQAMSEVNQENSSQQYPVDSYAMQMIKNIVAKINMQQEVNQIKIEPIFFIPPILDTDDEHSLIMKAYDLGYIPHLFAFNNPNNFSKLFQLDYRSDGRHLNHLGATEFTQILAEKFSGHLKSSQQQLSSY